MKRFNTYLLVAPTLALVATLPLMAKGAHAAGTQANRVQARLSRNSRNVGIQSDPVTFNMQVSAGAAACVPNATATVTITPTGPVEIMDVSVANLPANNDFDFFVI